MSYKKKFAFFELHFRNGYILEEAIRIKLQNVVLKSSVLLFFDYKRLVICRVQLMFLKLMNTMFGSRLQGALNYGSSCFEFLVTKFLPDLDEICDSKVIFFSPNTDTWRCHKLFVL